MLLRSVYGLQYRRFPAIIPSLVGVYIPVFPYFDRVSCLTDYISVWEVTA